VTEVVCKADNFKTTLNGLKALIRIAKTILENARPETIPLTGGRRAGCLYGLYLKD
jgi:hypothetical protein